MKKRIKSIELTSLGAKIVIAVVFFCCANSVHADSCNDHVVISQIYGGGGNNGATYKNDFIELYNPTDQNISLKDWSLQYVSATGSFPAISTASTVRSTLLREEIKAKTYYLIQENSNSDEGQPLEIPDATGFINLAADKGKIALVNNTTLINSENDSSVVDFVGYGSMANKYEGDAPAPSSSNTQSIIRYKSCLDSDNNNADFKKADPSPRNSNITEADEGSPGGGGESTDDVENNDDGTSQNTSNACAAASPDVKLNEIFPYPAGGEEFVEIVNTGESCVDISGWKIMDEAGHKKEFPANSTMDPGEYLSLKGNLYLNNDSDAVYLLDKNGNTKDAALDYRFYEKAQKDFSFSLDGESWLWTSTPTPGEKNIITAENSDSDNAENSDNYSSSKNIYLNEILPNPKGKPDDEYIEIVNGESEPVDLYKWTIRDASKTGKYVFKEHILIKSGEYLVIYKL